MKKFNTYSRFDKNNSNIQWGFLIQRNKYSHEYLYPMDNSILFFNIQNIHAVNPYAEGLSYCRIDNAKFQILIQEILFQASENGYYNKENYEKIL